jgi:hypothetical protein
MLASNTLASVNIGQSRLHLRYGTRLRSYQEDSFAASLHCQPATARAPPASRSATASSLCTFTTTGSARAHCSACRTCRYPVSSQSPSCNKRRPLVRQPARLTATLPAGRNHWAAVRKHARWLARCNRGSRQTALFSDLVRSIRPKRTFVIIYVVVVANIDIPHMLFFHILQKYYLEMHFILFEDLLPYIISVPYIIRGGIGKFPDWYCYNYLGERRWEGRSRSHFRKPIASVCHVTLHCEHTLFLH